MTFEHIKNLFFVAAMTAVAFYVIIPNGLHTAGVDTPGLTIGETFSQLEGRAYATAPELSLSSVTKGSFQDACEKYLNDIVPME